MPTYDYNLLDGDGKPTGEVFEWVQSMSSPALTKHPETGQPCSRAIVVPMVRHSGPAWDWCEATRRYINTMKPKYIRDDKTKTRKRYPQGGV